MDVPNLLGQTLSALIDEHWPSQRAFAEACGINHATLHHVLNGRPCSRENLRLFCQHISSDSSDRYAVLFAHLMDEAEASGLDMRNTVIRHLDEVTLAELRPDAALKRMLGIIGGEAMIHEDVRELVKSLADMIEASRKRAAEVVPFPSHSATAHVAEGFNSSIESVVDSETERRRSHSKRDKKTS